MSKFSQKPSLIFPYHQAIKWLGLVVLLFALAGLIFKIIYSQLDSLKPVPELISLGLIFIFFSKEKIDDERIHQFKFRSLSLGFLYSYFLTFGFQYLFSRAATAHEFIAVAMTFATSIYYFAKSKS